MRLLPAPAPRRRAALLPAIALAALAVAPAAPAGASTRAQLQKSLASQARALPGSSSVLVRDQATGATLAQRAATTRRIPASVTKVFTTSTALLLDGPQGRLVTELRIDGEIDDAGVLRGDLIVRGGGNPALRLDQIAQLAGMARRAGIRRIDGSLRADLAGWTRLQGTPSTGGAYHSDIGGRIGALVTLRGFARGGGSDPAAQVLSRLLAALRTGGLKGSVKLAAPAASGPSTTVLGRVSSPTMARLAAATNGPSDNFYAEMLLRGIGARHGAAGTTTAGIARQRAALAPLGVNAGTLADGSGLSRGNRVAPTTVVRLLSEMARRPAGPALRASLPLAGRSGTLAGRMRGTAAQDRCRAKTGTLSNVSALAGYCTTRGGRQVTFAILMNNVSPASARRAQDRIVTTIAGWSDRAAPVEQDEQPLETTPPSTSPGGTTPPAPAAAVAATPAVSNAP